MPVDVVLGLQWGDEGKGKIVDVLSQNYDFVARFQGGPNAGHTLVIDGNKYVLHQIPSGIFRSNVCSIIGNGAIINPIILKHEIESVQNAGIEVKKRLILSNKAHLILPTHHLIDKFREDQRELQSGSPKIGSTLKGISPTYQDKTARVGLRMGDIFKPHFNDLFDALYQVHLKSLPFELHEIAHDLRVKFEDACQFLKQFSIQTTELILHQALNENKNILAEGAQGTLLDIDFGSYPYVTSSNTTAGGVCTGLGIPPRAIQKVFGVTKAYSTRVGNGPFPTEQDNSTGENLRSLGHEYGATTGRPRRCGWLDLMALKYAVDLNGVTDLIVTKLDVLGLLDNFKVAMAYNYSGEEYFPTDNLHNVSAEYQVFDSWNNELLSNGMSFHDVPPTFQNFLNLIEQKLGIPVKVASIGPGREQNIYYSDAYSY